MTTSPNIRPNTCPRCGARLADHARLGFCSRCLAAISLAEPEPEAASEDDLAAVLPKTVAPARKETRFGDYELLEEIARGGMGVVYRARQPSLNRIVAVKMLLFGGLAGPEKLRRFRAEAAAAAALDHPYIVRILDAGEQDGQPFLAMEYVAGRDLAQLVSDRPLPARQAAGYVQKITRAIAFAHAHGVLHRDLKPSNVLINAFDEPQLTDFGLARHIAADSDLTHSGQVLGSPNFMPPEQCGVAADIRRRNSTPEMDDRLLTSAATNPRFGPWSDVYGLGAILYHLLTGRPPFLADTFEATLRQVLEHEPVPPRQLNPQIPRDLETICLKCLEKEPAKRYASAQELDADLGRFLSDEPIHARPIGPTARLWRWCRRKPALATAIVLVVAIVLVLGIGSPIAAFRINRERRKAEAQAYTSDMNVVQQAWDEGNLKRAQALLRAHIPKPGEPDLRSFEWRYLWNLCQDESEYAFTNFDHSIGSFAFSPAGHFLAVGAGCEIKLLDVNTREELTKLNYGDTNDDILCLAFSPTSTNILATGGDLGVVRFWNLSNHEITTFTKEPSAVPSVAFSPDGSMLAVVSRYALSVWNLEPKRLLWTTNLTIPPRAAEFEPDEKALISGGGGGNGNALVWEATTGKQLQPFQEVHTGWISGIGFSPYGRTLATCAADDRLILWDFTARRPEGMPISSGGNGFSFSTDGRLVACVGVDGVARIWDVASRRRVALLRGHLGPIAGLAFAPDGRTIVSGGADDRTIRIWDTSEAQDKNLLKGHKSWIPSLAFSPDGKTLASVDSYQGLTKLWDVPSRRFLADLPGKPQDRAAAVGGAAAFSPDGRLIATSSYSGTVMLWDAVTRQQTAVLTNDFASNASLAFSPDSKVLAVATGSPLHSRYPSAVTLLQSDGRGEPSARQGQRLALLSVASRMYLICGGFYDKVDTPPLSVLAFSRKTP